MKICLRCHQTDLKLAEQYTQYARLICGLETVITLYNDYCLGVPKSHTITKSAVVEGHVCTISRGGRLSIFIANFHGKRPKKPFMFLFDAEIIRCIFEEKSNYIDSYKIQNWPIMKFSKFILNAKKKYLVKKRT